MRDYLTRNIDKLSPDGVGICADGNDRAHCIFLKRFEEKMADQHSIIPRGIRSKLLEGQLLVSEILQSPVCQFIAASFVIAGKDSIRTQVVGISRLPKHLVNSAAKAKIRDDDRVRTGSGKIKLPIFICQSAVQCPSESLPVPSFAAELRILPDILFLRRSKTLPACCSLAQLDNVLIQLTATDVADMEFFADFEDFLVKKTAVDPYNNRHVASVRFSDLVNHMADHFLDRVAMIGMLIPAAKHGIDKVSAPVHLQWLESFLLFVGWLNAVPTISIIVIQDHRVNAKLYYMRLNYFQTPDKQLA